MLSFLNFILSLSLIVAVSLFAIANHYDVDLYMEPIGLVTTLPIYVPVTLAVMIGFFCGSFYVWGQALRARSERRQAQRRADRLEKELEDMQEKLSNIEETSSGLVDKNHMDDALKQISA